MPRKPALPAKPAVPVATKPPLPVKTPHFLPPWQTGTAAPVAAQLVSSVAPTLNDLHEPSPDEAYQFNYVHPKTAAVRRMFVAEFVKDFNGPAALARLGFCYRQPAVTSAQWLKEPFTQWLLDKYISEAETDALITRNRILHGLNREANSFGLDSSGASRVSAYGKLAKILGMDVDRSEVDVRVAGGIMLVPMSAGVDDWEKSASKAQATLKEGANK